jgi:GH15 family glucan-1,4-alpha-glucosidase
MKILLLGLLCFPAFAQTHAPPTPLVTGNGLGFTVYSFTTQAVSKFYAHPYRFEKPDPSDEFGEGIETTNFLKSLTFEKQAAARGPGAAHYLQESQIISVNDEEFYFQPFNLHENASIAVSKLSDCLNFDWTSKVLSQDFHGNSLVFTFEGTTEGVLLIPVEASQMIKATPSSVCGSSSWAMLSLENAADWSAPLEDFENWKKDRNGMRLVQDELAAFENWRKPASVQFQSEKEFKLWRQSETVLRMAQSRETNREGRNNNGLILASLPEGMWFVSWVRDMAFATLGLIRMGHEAEARKAILAYFNAQPVGLRQKDVRDLPYQISTVRYFGDGSEEPFFTMEGSPNIEFDNWGLVLWIVSEYVANFHDLSILNTPTHRGTIYEAARDLIATPLLGNLDPTAHGNIVSADTSIWEEYQWDKKHFAFSTITAINGLRNFQELSTRMNDMAFAERLRNELEKLQTGFDESFIHEGFVTGTSERNYKNHIDSAALDAINFSVVFDGNVIHKTIAKMELLKMPSGGYRRVRGDTDYEKQEFLYSNFSLARIYLRIGQPYNGYGMIETMVNKAAKDHNLIPEMYVSEKNILFPGQIGDPTGSIPMVGYGAGVFVTYILEREALSLKH